VLRQVAANKGVFAVAIFIESPLGISALAHQRPIPTAPNSSHNSHMRALRQHPRRFGMEIAFSNGGERRHKLGPPED